MTLAPRAVWALCFLGATVVARAGDPVLAPAVEDADRSLHTQANAEAGVLSSGYLHSTGLFGDWSTVRALEGRFVTHEVLLEGSVLEISPLQSGGAAPSYTLGARVGYAGMRFSGSVGVVAQFAPYTLPAFQIVPQLSLRYDFGAFALRAGLFDDHGIDPAQLVVEFGRFSAGYVAPLGATVAYRHPILRRGSVFVRALGFRLFNEQVLMFSVGAEVGEQKVGDR